MEGLLADDRGRIELPIARHPNHRTRMTADRAGLLPNSRPARTDWRVRARIGPATLLEIQLHTGRTHQIRVHMHSIGHALAGDPVYRSPRGAGKGPLAKFGRQALHAFRLGLLHPQSRAQIEWEAPVPADLQSLLDELRG